ncbi:GerMN domain-containing protein [Paenarthrobacter sp. NPDC089675]|uniref:GerMN domain-containing protein n=1 Tax=Paenarthrobacter sp. NPDC089675 TaxID=3364376 RepID=UPI003806D7FE
MATTGPAVGPSTEPPASPGPAARAAKAQLQPGSGPAVYYVAINDGGSRGVRFGCNDSLVAVPGAASPGDALTVALGRLLGAGMPLDNDAALYDSLAASSLRFVSGYVNGSTAVVNLSGSLRPGGVCDIPRIEAQLTHTVVAASGASRAEIYVNGMPLEVALSLR